jgi:hypothetical protein
VASAAALVLNIQNRFRSNVVSLLTGAALVDIAGLSLSMAASALYAIEGGVVFECGTSGGFAFGASLPALGAAGSWLKMFMQSAAAGQGNTGAGNPVGYAAFSAAAAGQTAIVSVSVITVNIVRILEIRGMIATSAAGTMQLMAKGSVAGATISVRGGYLRGMRIY